MKTKTKPSPYPPVPFHAIRAISFISNIIASGILIFFCFQLKNDGFKIPWTFLVALAASLINIIVLIATSAIHCCFRLSPIFNLVLNIPVLVLWILGFGLLAYNLYGTWAHTCVKANWGSDDGITICQLFKAMFSFVIFALLAHIAHIVMDIRARIAQTKSGSYAQMRDSTSTLKLEPYKSVEPANHADPHPSVYDSRPSFDAAPGWRPGQHYQDSSSVSTSYQPYSAAAPNNYSAPASSVYSVPTTSHSSHAPPSNYSGGHSNHYANDYSREYPTTNYYSGRP